MPVCLAGLFLLIDGSGPWRAGLLGLTFGIGWFTAGFWWIMPGLNQFTEAGPLLSAGLTAALVIYLSLFPAAAAALVGLLSWRPRGSGPTPTPSSSSSSSFSPLLCIVIASVWTLSEWCRGNAFGGMPWLTIGYSQVPGPLAGYAPVIGVYGITLVTAFLGSACAAWLTLTTSKLFWTRENFRLTGLCVALLFVGLFFKQVAWTQDTGRELTVRLLQGNLPQQEKFSSNGLIRALSTYAELASGERADLTVLPETAFPIAWSSLPAGVLSFWHSLSQTQNSVVLIGAAALSETGSGSDAAMTNSAFAIAPAAVSATDAIYRYDKSRLVPFGEFMPPGAKWLAPRLNVNFGEFVPGTTHLPALKVAAAAVAIGICFENLFDVETAIKAENANLIVNISNFAWFANSYAPAQHLQAGQMRALETGRWLVQSANTGVTAVVDEHGVVSDALPPNVSGVLYAHVKTFSGNTPFMLAGNKPLLSFCLAAIAVALVRRFGRKDSGT